MYANNWASGCPRAASFSWVIPACVCCTWLTALNSAAAEGLMEEEAWQNTRERQCRPGSSKSEKILEVPCWSLGGAIQQLSCTTAGLMPEHLVWPCAFTDCRGQSHCKLCFTRAEKLTADSGNYAGNGNGKQPLAVIGLLSLGHNFPSSTCFPVSSFQKFHKY